MNQTIIYTVIGALIGAIIGWLLATLKSGSKVSGIKELLNSVEKEFETFKATSTANLSATTDKLNNKESDLKDLETSFTALQGEKDNLSNNHITATAQLKSNEEKLKETENTLRDTQQEQKSLTTQLSNTKSELATVKAYNSSLEDKLKTQKQEIEELRKQFKEEFKNLATEILEDKSKRFTELNKNNLEELINPLKTNIKDFKTKVEEVYDKESKQRFSLEEKVKELADLNKVISKEARELTDALKNKPKAQGRWGEIMLENILEKSGLRKNEEFFMEAQLYDKDGKALLSELQGKRMRPDALVKYPDERNVIIDSKVSLNAFTRYMSAEEIDTQKSELQQHLTAVKAHITDLSKKGYDDFDKSLDFVMMFIPSESAYIAAMQADPNLWQFAYEKRILLLNPTNLITSLKLIVDLWKREYQNQNAIEIASRGEKLYKKFVGFIENIEKVGDSLTKAEKAYNDAYKQLSTGNDNLVTQATKLKKLGNFKLKKDLPQSLLEKSEEQENSED